VYKPLLILDLDETLVHATTRSMDAEPAFRAAGYDVYRRPNLDAFLEQCFSIFDVAVWTSAGRDYATEIVHNVFGGRELRFFWAAERCTRRVNLATYEQYNVKDLKKVRRLGVPLERVLMVDDSPEKLERNYGNYIRVTPFLGNMDDAELPKLARYLDMIRGVANYRTIEKRHWRNQV
jgi:TFIIF-interacting CTD phosphatase-like protein